MELRCGNCGKCRLCQLARTDAKYRKHWGTDGKSSRLPLPLPVANCSYLGFSANRRDGDSRDWKICDHQKKPLGLEVCACAGCGVNCPGYEPNDQVSYYLPGVLDPLLIGPYRKFSASWAAKILVKERHHQTLLSLVKENFQYPGGYGRGIVTCGGGRYFPMAITMIKMLRNVGYSGMVELWYRGSCEAIDHTKLHNLDVHAIDIDVVSNLADDNRIPKEVGQTYGWAMKWYALTHTKFDKVIWLDADFIPLMDPSVLFGLDDSIAYWSWHENWIKWKQMGWEGIPKNIVTGFQSGQFFIDRTKMWKMMAIVNWMCQHFDFYCADPKTRFVLGDQEAAMVVMTLLGIQPKILGFSEWPSHGASYKLDGTPFGEHPFLVKLFDHGPAYREAMKVFSEVMSN